jgi:hypothetical protein
MELAEHFSLTGLVSDWSKSQWCGGLMTWGILMMMIIIIAAAYDERGGGRIECSRCSILIPPGIA